MIDIQDRIYDSRDDVKKLILSVINDEVKAIELPFNNIKHYIDIIESLNLEKRYLEIEQLTLNTVVKFIKGEIKFYLHGDMFDSETLTFSIAE